MHALHISINSILKLNFNDSHLYLDSSSSKKRVLTSPIPQFLQPLHNSTTRSLDHAPLRVWS